MTQHTENGFIKRSYKSELLHCHFKRAMRVNRKAFLQTKGKLATQKNLPLVVTFNKTLSNIKNFIDKHWHIFSINEKLKKAFEKKPFIVYRRNKNLHQKIKGKNCA